MGGVGTITVNTATWGGEPAGSATVTITGGPNGGTYTGTTNSSGVSGAITVPATTATLAVQRRRDEEHGRRRARVTVTSVTNGGNTNAAVAITPTKSVVLTVQRSTA